MIALLPVEAGSCSLRPMPYFHNIQYRDFTILCNVTLDDRTDSVNGGQDKVQDLFSRNSNAPLLLCLLSY